MSRAGGTAFVWFLSCLPVALPALYPPAEISLASAPILGLTALPWIAWAGVPWRSRAGSSIATSALALPPLAAALAIEVGRGASLSAALVAALACGAMIAMLGFGACLASGSGVSRVFDLAWLALVPGLAVLRVALELGGAPAYGRAPGWLAFLAGASPIAWAFRPSASPWPGIAICAVLLLCARSWRKEATA